MLRYFSTSIFLFLLLFSLATSTLGYCANNHTATQEEIPEYGDSLVSGMLAEPSNLLPFMATDSASHEVASLFYIAPLRYDKNIQVAPWAAESFEILDNGLRLKFSLRKGILWEDGVELTADDVEFTYKLMIDPQTPTAYSGDFKAVKQFNKIDRYTFEVIYDKPFPRSLATWMQKIMPKHKLDGENLTTTSLARKPISCGTYTMKQWEPGTKIVTQSNPKYFEGKPYIDNYVFRIIPDSTTLFLELKARKIDMLGSITPQQYKYQAIKPPVADYFNAYKSLSFSYTYLGYNLKSPIFSDKRVRQAFAYAINKQDIIKGALLDEGVATIGPYSPSTWAYNKNIQHYPIDLNKAQALLSEAGWKKNKHGQLEKDGVPFSFTILTNQGNDLRLKVATIIQSQLKPLGIEAKIRVVEWVALTTHFIKKGYFDAVITGWTIPQDPDSYDIWHSSRRGTGLNYINYANEEVDDLLEKARSTFDIDRRKQLYDRLQEILHDEQPYCFLFVPNSVTLVHKRVKGIEPAPAGISHNYPTWWVPAHDQLYKLQVN